MRVGVLAKGLLLHERLDVDLVVLCHGKKLFFTYPQTLIIIIIYLYSAKIQ